MRLSINAFPSWVEKTNSLSLCVSIHDGCNSSWRFFSFLKNKLNAQIGQNFSYLWLHRKGYSFPRDLRARNNTTPIAKSCVWVVDSTTTRASNQITAKLWKKLVQRTPQLKFQLSVKIIILVQSLLVVKSYLWWRRCIKLTFSQWIVLLGVFSDLSIRDNYIKALSWEGTICHVRWLKQVHSII